MNDFLIYAAGGLGMIIAVVHGYIGEVKVVAPVTGINRSAKRVLSAVMFLSAIYWFAAGALLVVAPLILESDAKRLAAFFVGTIYLSGALANFWATRGRHFGWMLLAIATALAWLGA